MNSLPLTLAALAAFCLAPAAGLKAQEKMSADWAAGEAAVKEEADLVLAARIAAREDREIAVDTNLTKAGHPLLATTPGALLARRTAAICAGLHNDRELERSKKLAQKTLKQLERLAVDGSTADQLERLCWEAWLHGEALEDKKTALRLLAEAEKLNPEDMRVIYGKRIWQTAD